MAISLFRNKKLRAQLVISHLLLVLLMVVVMAGAVASFFSLGRSIDRIFKNNYKSVVAAQQMKDALERIDSSATFVLAGQTARARQQYETYKPKFEAAYQVEAHNITEPGEGKLANEIGRGFASYSKNVEKLLYATPPMPTEAARKHYFDTLEPAFLGIKQHAQDVLNINQAAIIRADNRAKAEASAATWRSIAITALAILLAILLALRMIHAIIDPIKTFAKQAEEVGAGHLDQHISVGRQDEIGALADAFNSMTDKLRAARRVQEQQLHLAQRMSDAALTSLYDPIIVTDANGRILNVNRATEGVFGPSDKLVGRKIAEAIPRTEIVQAITDIIARCGAESPEVEPERVQIHVDSSTRTYLPRAATMCDDDGTVLGAVAVLEDVTHLTELDRMKTEFISVASHELRTPVASLLLAAGLLDEGAAGELSPKQHQLVTTQLEDLHRLDGLMRDLLDLTRLELGTTPPKFEVVQPPELVKSAIDAVASQIDAKGIILTSEFSDDLPNVRADREQITRVLVNLLSNSIRHTPTGGRITVRARQTDAQIEFAVQDTGSGIPKVYLPSIFERFVQVPGATGGGAGLGLSIAQAIVKAHGGQISAESEVGQGSTFTFTLPVA